MNAHGFEFIGYIENINIKGTGSTGNQFLFALISLDGDQHWSFHLDPSEPRRYAAMSSLLASAFAAGTVVSLNTVPNIGHQPFAAEIEVLRKLHIGR
jgi:hypothetical protein